MKRLIVLSISAVIFFSCSAAKHDRHKNKSVTAAPERKKVYIDTISAKLDLMPEKGYTLVLENIQVYVVAKEQPGVGFTITPAKGEATHNILPQYSNSESFSFGGGVHFELHEGDKGLIDIFTVKGKPLPSRIIVMGYQQK